MSLSKLKKKAYPKKSTEDSWPTNWVVDPVLKKRNDERLGRLVDALNKNAVRSANLALEGGYLCARVLFVFIIFPMGCVFQRL